MKIIVKAITYGDYCEGPEYCLITLSQGDMNLTEKRISALEYLKSIDSQFYCAEFFDYSAEWFDTFAEFDDAGMYNELELDGYVIVPDDFTIPEDKVCRVECSMLSITTCGLIWKAYIKYSDPTVEVTLDDSLNFEWLKKVFYGSYKDNTDSYEEAR